MSEILGKSSCLQNLWKTDVEYT